MKTIIIDCVLDDILSSISIRKGIWWDNTIDIYQDDEYTGITIGINDIDKLISALQEAKQGVNK